MIGPNIDILGNQINDYDLVWLAGERGLSLACVKKVRVSFRRVNPAYNRRGWCRLNGIWVQDPAQAQIPRHISGIEDKYLCVSTGIVKGNLTELPAYISKYRIDSIELATLKVEDPFVLNSDIANHLITEARKIKK